MSSSKLNRQSTTRTPGSPIADATRSVDQKRSARGSVLTSLTLSALGFPGHEHEEGSREGVVRHGHRSAVVMSAAATTATAKTVESAPPVQFVRASLGGG